MPALDPRRADPRLARLDLVKIDAEGADWACSAGFRRLCDDFPELHTRLRVVFEKCSARRRESAALVEYGEDSRRPRDRLGFYSLFLVRRRRRAS